MKITESTEIWYITDDGLRYKTKAEAERHIARTALAQRLDRTLGDNQGDIEVVEFILDNFVPAVNKGIPDAEEIRVAWINSKDTHLGNWFRANYHVYRK